jgi:beta-lactamase superfamily II metal-dependent hydrolase
VSVVFSLEALQAFHGDALLLHVGEKLILIDGGPTRTWATTLRPRLEELRAARAADGGPLRIDLAMVSHIDDDHIHGLTDMGGALVELEEDSLPVPYELGGLWHNAFDDVLGNRADEVPAAGAPVVASVGQGRTLRDQAIRLGWPRNEPFGGLVIAPREVPFGAATLTVVAPDTEALDRLDREWEEWLAHHPASAQVAEFADTSVFNLSSIVVLAEADDRRMLLCGDARGDHVLEGLEAAGRMAGGELALDLLKLPHHGSIRNVAPEFFERLPARHYLISADGRDGNPETATLDAIAASRADDDFTIHLTNREGKLDLAQRLDAFLAARDAAGRRFGVSFRDPAALGLRVDLADPPEDA